MKLRAALKYQLYSCLKVIAVYYGALLALNALFALLSMGQVGVTVNGGDMSSLIVLFVLGLSGVKEPFRLLAVSGRTRRTAFSAIVLALLITSALMVVVDMLFNLALGPFFSSYRSLYGLVYGEPATLLDTAVKFSWSFVLLSCAAITGAWISALYYRMSKPLKIGVSVGVPALLFFALPIVEINYTHGAIMKGVGKAILYVFGLGGTSPAPAMFCLWGTLIALASAGIFWALLRRAEIKE